MRLALFEPDIPQNCGALIRLGACMNVPVDIIEPCGFPLSDRGLKRAGMDYLELANITRHESWEAFRAALPQGIRLVLLTTKASQPFTAFQFRAEDVLLLGRESAGVPDNVHKAADARLTIPMQPPARSLNVAIAAAMVLSEALRQTSCFPATRIVANR
jgi:tRNA (cytidine/uridine-2'-O-)-methyltransferase